MFKIIDTQEYLSQVFKLVSDLSSETTIKINDKGLHISAKNSSAICMIQGFLSAKDFDFFDCKNEIEVGLDAKKFYKFLKLFNKEPVSFSLEHNAIRLKSEIEDLMTKDFQLQLLELNGFFEKDPVYTYDLLYKLESIETLAEVFKNIEAINAIAVDLKGDANELIFEAGSYTSSSAKISLKTGIYLTLLEQAETRKVNVQGKRVEQQVVLPVEATYPLDPVKIFIAYSKQPGIENCELGFGYWQILYFKFSMGESSFLHGFIAPQIEKV